MSADTVAMGLARELVLLGAEAAVVERDATATRVFEGFEHARDRFADLGARMVASLEKAQRGAMARRLLDGLGLTPLGYWLVLLAAAAELHPEAAAALSILSEDERVHLVTPTSFAKLMRSALGAELGEAMAEAIAGGAAERLGLVERLETNAQKPLTQAPLRLTADEARHHLLGTAPEVEATSLTISREAPAAVLGNAAEVVAGARALLEEHGVLCLRSPAARWGRQLAMDVAASFGVPALLVGAGGDDPPSASEVARLRGGVVVVDLFATCQAKAFPDAWLRTVAAGAPLVMALVPPNAGTATWPTVEVEELGLPARERVFASEVPGAGAADLALRFRVSVDEVRAAARAARTQDRLTAGNGTAVAPTASSVAREVLAQGSRRMGRMVTHLPGRARMQDLVVPAAMHDTLADVVGYFRARPHVAALGLRRASTLGTGLSCLFSGGPGTGKTFAAQCLATELQLNLYRIDLSQVVSKYIGETEKALQRVFEEAEAGHGMLLFDEADALFGKRSEVKDAHDRYANVEVAFLLQRMESFDGISILTTNLRSHIDTAFLRRLRFVVEFPMPDAPARRRLWEASLPAPAHWEPALDLTAFVERFAFSGGNIHNVGLAAAHLCAAEPGGRLGARHLARATYRELEKVGLGRSREDFGPLWEHLPHGDEPAPPPRAAELRARAASARRAAAERGRA